MTGLQGRLETSVDQKGPGMVAVATIEGTSILCKAVGMADLARGTPLRIDSVFRIASLSKHFTATAVLLLAQRGRLRLEDPARRWLPELPTALAGVTLYQLLTHTSGIPDYTRREDFATVRRERLSPRTLVAYCSEAPPEFRPGSARAYSNSGYVLLGEIVARAAAVNFDDFLVEHIGRPLGLRSLGFGYRDRDAPGQMRGYVAADGAWRDAAYLDTSVAYAAGAVTISGVDLAAFYDALLGGRLLEPAWRARLFARVEVQDGILPDAAMIGRIGEVHGEFVYLHSGDIDGYSAFALLSPERRLVVVCLANREAAPLSEIAVGLATETLERVDHTGVPHGGAAL